jgi:hypothetical protein
MSNTEPVNKYDSNGNLIHSKYSDGYEAWYEFDSDGNCIHYKNSSGHENWRHYGSSGKLINYKSSSGLEKWYWEGEETDDPVKILLLAAQLHSEVSQ